MWRYFIRAHSIHFHIFIFFSSHFFGKSFSFDLFLLLAKYSGGESVEENTKFDNSRIKCEKWFCEKYVVRSHMSIMC